MKIILLALLALFPMSSALGHSEPEWLECVETLQYPELDLSPSQISDACDVLVVTGEYFIEDFREGRGLQIYFVSLGDSVSIPL